MTSELQHLASIANLLSCIDGSVTRACLECGAIFKVSNPDAPMLCKTCNVEPCCDEPNWRTIRVSASREDEPVFATRVCENCGKRKEVEL